MHANEFSAHASRQLFWGTFAVTLLVDMVSGLTVGGFREWLLDDAADADAMREISGVGEKKAQAYASEVARVISQAA